MVTQVAHVPFEAALSRRAAATVGLMETFLPVVLETAQIGERRWSIGVSS